MSLRNVPSCGFLLSEQLCSCQMTDVSTGCWCWNFMWDSSPFTTSSLLPPSLLLFLLPLPLFLPLPPRSIVFLPFLFLFLLPSSSSSRSYWAMCLCQAVVIQKDSEVTLLDLLFWPKHNCHCLLSPASLYLIHSEHTMDTVSHGWSGCKTDAVAVVSH